jgi:hypothetical protein
MQNVNAAKLPQGDPLMFFVKLQGCNLYTSDFVFVPQFTRCSVVLRDRERGRQMRYSIVGGRFAHGKNKVGRRLDIFRIMDYDAWIVEARPASGAFLATPWTGISK